MQVKHSVLIVVYLLLSLILLPVSPVLANNPHYDNDKRDFGSCKNPKGTLKVSYAEGWHWLVGNPQLQWGSDAVYDLGEDAFLQCYCPIDDPNKPHLNKGLQTNWWFAESLPAEKIQKLQKKGWILVAQGTDFGLTAGKYLVKNKKYSCEEKEEKEEKHEHRNRD